nr:hypothetical protein [Tanacetum cinerariifolium]
MAPLTSVILGSVLVYLTHAEKHGVQVANVIVLGCILAKMVASILVSLKVASSMGWGIIISEMATCMLTLEFRAPILVDELLQRYPGAEAVVALSNHHYNFKLKSGNMYYLVPKSSQVSKPRVVNKDEEWGGCERKRIKVVITKQQLEQLVSNQISIQNVMMKQNQAPCWSKKLESIPEEWDDEIESLL